MSKVKAEMVRLETLKINERNPRIIRKAAFEKLCKSIRDFPKMLELRPIIIDKDGVIIGGTQRYRALVANGNTEVPAAWVRRADTLTPAERKRFIVADNAPDGMSGEWDDDILAADFELPELEDLGFTNEALSQIYENQNEQHDAEPQVNKAEELQVKWATKRGQLWAIGDHLLLCGDSTNAEDVSLVLGAAKPVLMVTDPPYGIEYDPTWRADAGVNKNKGKMGVVTNDDVADWSPAWRLFPGDVAYVYHSDMMSSTVHASLEVCGFKIRAQIIWAKDRMALSRGDYHWQHEACWYAVRDGKPGHRTEDRKQTTLWEIPARDDSGHGHGTQKPIECMARPMRNHHAQEVYDPFLGSGTTMVAAQNLGRKCYGIEISPAYCAVILERMITAFPELDIHKIKGKI